MTTNATNRRFIENIEANQAKLKQEKAAADAVAALAEERLKTAYSQRDELSQQNSKLQIQLDVSQKEKETLEEKLQRAESALQGERTNQRTNEGRWKDVQVQNEELLSKCVSVEADLALSISEKRGVEDTLKRSEQLCEHLRQGLARTEAVEAQNKTLQEELTQLKSEAAVLRAEKEGLGEVHRRSEEGAARTEAARVSLLDRVETAEARAREVDTAREGAVTERNRILEQLAELQGEKKALDEALTRMQVTIREETTRCERNDEASRERIRQCEAIAGELARANEQLTAETTRHREAEARAAQLEARGAQLEAMVADAHKTQAEMKLRVETAEARVRETDTVQQAVAAEQQQFAQKMAAEQEVVRLANETSMRTEARLKEALAEKGALHVRMEEAEIKAKDMIGLREMARDERGRAMEHLAAAQVEKLAAEELVRRCELQIRSLNEDKAALLTRMDVAEERCMDAMRQRDAIGEERLRISEELTVVQTERRVVEEVLRRFERRMDDERGAERRCNELVSEQDALKQAWQQMAEELAAAKDEAAMASKELAAYGNQKRSLQELLQRTEGKLQAEQVAHRSDLEAAEQQYAEAARQRDEALAQRTRAAEALATAEADRRHADEATLKLTAEVKAKEGAEEDLYQRLRAAEERNRELSAQAEFAQAGLKEGEQARSDLLREKAALAQELAVRLSEKRVKEQHMEDELQAAQARCDNAEERYADLTAHQEMLQTERARLEESNNSLREERDRLEHERVAMQEEKRGLELAWDRFRSYGDRLANGSSPGSAGSDSLRPQLRSTPSTAAHRPMVDAAWSAPPRPFGPGPDVGPQAPQAMRYGHRELAATQTTQPATSPLMQVRTGQGHPLGRY